jgi:hypothetical protein
LLSGSIDAWRGTGKAAVGHGRTRRSCSDSGEFDRLPGIRADYRESAPIAGDPRRLPVIRADYGESVPITGNPRRLREIRADYR